MKPTRLIPLAAILVLPLAHAGSNGELWEVTSKMGAMPGMPAGYAMPAQVNRVCVPAGRGYQSAAGNGGKDKSCQIVDMKTSGSHTSYRVECSGKEAVSGKVDIEQAGPDAYKGTMQMKAHGMDMTMAYAGKKVGSCDYVEPAAKAK